MLAAFIWAWNNVETFRNVVVAANMAVYRAFQVAVAFIKQKLDQLVGWLREIPGKIKNFFSGIGSWLIGSGRALVDGFLSGIRGAWDRVVGFVRQGMQWLRDLWPFSPAKDGPFSGRGYVTFSGAALTEDFAASLRRGMPMVADAASDVLGAAQGGLSANVRVGSVPGGVSGTSAASSSGRTVRFEGNVDAAFAAAFQKLVRTGQIVIA